MAMGARAWDVLSLVVRQGMTIVLAGMVVGVAGAVAMARLLGRFLVGSESTDPATYGGSFALLALAAVLACWIPAGASRLSPVEALRNE
jgi:ABC-type antimicrobial peptide transport system permease subunit